MKLEFDPEFLQWFSKWPGEFDWDDGNVRKNEKHGITHADIEKIFDSPVYVAGKIVATEEESRWLVLGEVEAKGRTLVVTTRGLKLRVISCRRQRKKEAKFYEGIKKENESE